MVLAPGTAALEQAHCNHIFPHSPLLPFPRPFAVVPGARKPFLKHQKRNCGPDCDDDRDLCGRYSRSLLNYCLNVGFSFVAGFSQVL